MGVQMQYRSDENEMLSQVLHHLCVTTNGGSHVLTNVTSHCAPKARDWLGVPTLLGRLETG